MEDLNNFKKEAIRAYIESVKGDGDLIGEEVTEIISALSYEYEDVPARKLAQAVADCL